MRFNPVPLMAILLWACLLSVQVQAQVPDSDRYRISLKSGSFVPAANISGEKIEEMNLARRPGGKSLIIIQFESIPGEREKNELRQAGIELLDYVPNKAYTALLTGSPDAALLKKHRTRAVFELQPEHKLEPRLASGMTAGALKSGGTTDVWISFPRSYSYGEVKREMGIAGFEIVSSEFQNYHVVVARVSSDRLRELAALPFVEYVQAAPGEDQPLNNKSRASTKANILNNPLPGGRNLKGEGVVIGVGDDSDPTRHMDFNGRLINRAPNPGGSHGLHVMGTVGGAGIRNELYTGFAPKSTIVAQRFSGILWNAPNYVQDFGMTITNNSYGDITDCSGFGIYDLASRIMDQHAFLMPGLQHVFAAGNSGNENCSPYPVKFGTVLGGYQSAKNLIAVGNIDAAGVVYNNSSRGPVRDGRLKPEIVAQGTQVFSTTPTNNYGLNTGTSMAAPAVAGGLGLLYERYRQLNSGNNPDNGLMKALLCNGATDIGTPGIDFTYGFGQMNLLRSVTMLENNNYFNGTVATAGNTSHSITIPAGSSIAQLKVMLYWNDSAAAVFAANALVNDLDLSVTDPAATVYLPQILNVNPASVADPATTGADHINNIEQVVINNPGPGTYNFVINGTSIPFGGQHAYYLVFDTIPVSTLVTYPAGGEKLQGGDAVYVQWESYGNPSNDFTIQFSDDDGASWTNVTNGANVSAGLRQLAWTVPAVVTELARIKIIHNGTGIESISDAFTIIGVPTLTLAATANQCEGYINLNWSAVIGATDYEVMLFNGVGEMTPVGTTTSTNYIFGGLSRDTTYWVTVRARINGQPGRRATAVSRLPSTGTCSGTISDNDLKVDAILSPESSGRKFTSTELSNSVPVTVRIENLDNASTSGDIQVAYIFNSNAPVVELIAAPSIGNRASYNHTFATPIDLSAVGDYDLKVYVSYAGDPYQQNDTMSKVFRQLDNTFIDLTTDFIDDIEAAPVFKVIGQQIGLPGLDRYDFNATTAFGQVQSFINTGIASSGSKALTLDVSRYTAAGNTDSLTGTFNLQGYNTTADEIRLDFMYKHHGQVLHNANKVWIRGSDQDSWIEVYDLYANQGDVGVYKRSASIELSDILDAAGPPQAFSSSFQVRWGQWGLLNATDNENGAGYTFDDIRLYRVTNDIQMISIDTPTTASCDLGNLEPVRVSIRNAVGATINSIPINLQVDGGAVVTEIIPTIPGKTTASYTFTATADLSAPGYHTVKVWVDLGSDSFHDNDTTQITIFNAQLVASFPYLQDFETDDGGWHTEGNRVSWQYGTPSSPQINKAASGTQAWKTSLAGHHNSLEKSYLVSPCFDIAGLANPMLSFSVALDIEDCVTSLCDAAYVEYSADGKTWTRLGTDGEGTNWYNRNFSGNAVWSVENYTRWHVASIPLPSGLDRLRLRFVMESDPFVTREGIAIDDIHIYDSIYSIYDGPPFTSVVVNQANLTGNNWVDFVSDGMVIASVQPNGQNMGNTDAQAFIHTGAVRINSGQYYHNRNITIKPANTSLADSAVVRFYFLDAESEALINATGCGTCGKPASAYELGVTKYSHTNDALENGTLADNTGGVYSFILPANVKKVPFDKGYYAEFKVKDFSEFWLNNGGPTLDQPLPVELLSFVVRKNDQGEALLNWATASEMNTGRFEIELARGNDAFNQNNFVKIGFVNSGGNASTEQHYSFIDAEAHKQGVRYYRLKIVDLDGQFTYSPVRSVVFDDEIRWQVYPNPSGGVFNFVFQANLGEAVQLKVYDINGRLVRHTQSAASAFVQKLVIDMEGPQYASGLYLLEVTVNEKRQLFRLLKQ